MVAVGAGKIVAVANCAEPFSIAIERRMRACRKRFFIGQPG